MREILKFFSKSKCVPWTFVRDLCADGGFSRVSRGWGFLPSPVGKVDCRLRQDERGEPDLGEVLSAVVAERSLPQSSLCADSSLTEGAERISLPLFARGGKRADRVVRPYDGVRAFTGIGVCRSRVLLPRGGMRSSRPREGRRKFDAGRKNHPPPCQATSDFSYHPPNKRASNVDK